MSTLAAKTLRCAVYTRKSSEEGLDQAFNSLDAQREAGLDYIKSQRHQGWTAVATAYDDGGYSGGTTDRPALQRLLTDIRRGQVDVVLVYKVDRLSRSLADFARLMQLFDESRVSFVSVTQQFNTTTSMGRLTLNMLLSFAQFEREVAGERVRDKIAATKRRGVWVCGRPPLGYRLPRQIDPAADPSDRVIRVIEPEAALVRAIFGGYLKSGSLVKVAKELSAAGHTTQRSGSNPGKRCVGKPLSTAFVYRVLTNPIYTGKITHTRGQGESMQTEVYPGQHVPIIDQSTWERVRAKMSTVERETRYRWTHTHLLKKKLRTFEGYSMTPAWVLRRPTKRADANGPRGPDGRLIIRYYTSLKAVKHGYSACPIKNINSGHIDDLVRALVVDHLGTRCGLDLRCLESSTRDHWIREVLGKVVLAPDRLTIELVGDRIAACSEALRPGTAARASQPAAMDRDEPVCPFAPQVEESGPHTVLSLQVKIKRHDGKRVLLSPEGHDLFTTVGAEGSHVPRPHLVTAVGRAFAWRHQLLKTRGTVESVAQSAGVTDAHVHLHLLLTQLGPTVLRSVLTGSLGPSITLADLLRAAARLDWSQQMQVLGILTRRLGGQRGPESAHKLLVWSDSVPPTE